MRLLTLDNTVYDLTSIPEEVDDVRFCVLDNSDPKDPDYFFIPLILTLQNLHKELKEPAQLITYLNRDI